MNNPESTWAFDIECYPNWTYAFFLSGEGEEMSIELKGESGRMSAKDRTAWRRWIADGKTSLVSFNGKRYDIPILAAMTDGKTARQIHRMSSDIIDRAMLPATALRLHDARPIDPDHVDLFQVAPGKSSLKTYGARMHMPKLESLPIAPDSQISAASAEILREYCKNDCETTMELRRRLDRDLELRALAGQEADIDLRSLGDAQIGERLICAAVGTIKPRIDWSQAKFTLSKAFRAEPGGGPARRAEALDGTAFDLSPQGRPLVPDILKEPVRIGDAEYRMGVGGLHSSESRMSVAKLNARWRLEALDVTSYYPNIILAERYWPQSLGPDFLDAYESLVRRREKAKAEGDKRAADSLKIAINGCFGKLGSQHSPLYSPSMFLNVTLNGQLLLLDLIESLEAAGIAVISANTDGLVAWRHAALDAEMAEAKAEWEARTSLKLESEPLRAVHHRDVNNYFWVREDGAVKRKGAYAESTLMRNPAMDVCADAAARWLADGTPVDESVASETRAAPFLTVRKVSGGALYANRPLGETVRWYWSKSPQDECVRNRSGSRVPGSTGAQVAMDLPPERPPDIDLDRYADRAAEILDEIGARKIQHELRL